MSRTYILDLIGLDEIFGIYPDCVIYRPWGNNVYPVMRGEATTSTTAYTHPHSGGGDE